MKYSAVLVMLLATANAANTEENVNKKRNLIRRRDEEVLNKRQQMKQIKNMQVQSITLDTLIEEAEKVEEEMEEVEELIEEVVNTPVEIPAAEHPEPMMHPEPMIEGGEPSEGGDDMALRMHNGKKHKNNKNKKSHKKKNNKKNNKSKNKKNNKNSSKANKNDRPSRNNSSKATKPNMRAHTGDLEQETDPMHQVEAMEAHIPSYGGKARKLTRGA